MNQNKLRKSIVGFLMVLVYSAPLYGQQTVSGTVTDAQTEESLPGVNIKVKSTPTGTATDANGQYELNVKSQQDTLVFSFVGYQTQQVTIGSRAVINVALQPQAISGEEMVVVGYGTQSRRRLTTSISQVGGDQVEETPISNVGEGLKGKISGARIYDQSGVPGQDPTIRIRGGSSINRSNDPLVLVDGIERSLSDINPNDIAKITVLKDAASTAIYGSRASNGVVLITTKKQILINQLV